MYGRRLFNKRSLGLVENFLTYKKVNIVKPFSVVCNHVENKQTLLNTTLQIPQKTQFLRYCSHKDGVEVPKRNTETESDDQNQSQKEINFERITGGDPVLDKKLRILMLEAEVMRQDGQRIPANDFIKEAQWKELLSKPSRSARKKYLTFLFKIEKMKESRQKKKIIAKEKYLESVKNSQDEDDGHIKYGLGHNTIFIRIYDTTINDMYNNRLIQAMQFGQQIVIDCGYDEHMNEREMNNTGSQLTLLFAENRANREPFDLHFCNANWQERTMQYLRRRIPTVQESYFPLNIHTESYLDLFPKDKLVYMTPHCRDDLLEYDHDAVYIVGAMVDKTNNEPLSLAKAKREGIKMKRLPLDRYLQWSEGSGKSLTLNQMVSILLDLKNTGDWNYALRHVPRRKIVQPGSSIDNDAFNLRFDKNRSRSAGSYRENFKSRPVQKSYTSKYRENFVNNSSHTDLKTTPRVRGNFANNSLHKISPANNISQRNTTREQNVGKKSENVRVSIADILKDT